MMTNPKIYKAVMTLAEADPWEVDKVFEKLWNEAQLKKPPARKRHFILASDIAALVRDRLRNTAKLMCTACQNIQTLGPLELPICDNCGGGMFTQAPEEAKEKWQLKKR